MLGSMGPDRPTNYHNNPSITKQITTLSPCSLHTPTRYYFVYFKTMGIENDVSKPNDTNTKATTVESEDRGDGNEFFGEDSSTHRNLFYKLLKLSYPIMLCEFFQCLLTLVDIAFVGHLSKESLAVAALATAWFNLWNLAMHGFMTAIDTMLSQSYGAQQYLEYGIWTGISLVFVFFATIIVSGGMALCQPVMNLIVSNPDLAQEAGLFALRLIPGLFPYYFFYVFAKYFQNANILAPPAWIGFIANGLNILFNWLLIFRAGWGIAGSPWATSLTRLAELILIVLVVLFEKNNLLEHLWPKLSLEHFSSRPLRSFVDIAVPGALALLGWGGFFEATTLMASKLGETSLGAHAIALNVVMVCYITLAVALGDAAAILVGRFTGDKNWKDAKKSSDVALLLSYILQSIVALLLLCLRKHLGLLFSRDEDVVSIVSGLIPIVCVYLLCDATAAAFGVLRGVGRQELFLCTVLLGYWVVAMPVAYLLAFKTNLDVFGLWWGMTIGVLFSTFTGLFVLFFKVDWQKETVNASERLSSLHAADGSDNSAPLLGQSLLCKDNQSEPV